MTTTPLPRTPLIALLKQRNLTLTRLAEILHPHRTDPQFSHAMVRTYLPHLSKHLAGRLPIYNTTSGRAMLNPTWRRLQRVLTGEEFDAALAFAKENRKTAQND